MSEREEEEKEKRQEEEKEEEEKGKRGGTGEGQQEGFVRILTCFNVTPIRVATLSIHLRGGRGPTMKLVIHPRRTLSSRMLLAAGRDAEPKHKALVAEEIGRIPFLVVLLLLRERWVVTAEIVLGWLLWKAKEEEAEEKEEEGEEEDSNITAPPSLPPSHSLPSVLSSSSTYSPSNSRFANAVFFTVALRALVLLRIRTPPLFSSSPTFSSPSPSSSSSSSSSSFWPHHIDPCFCCVGGVRNNIVARPSRGGERRLGRV